MKVTNDNNKNRTESQYKIQSSESIKHYHFSVIDSTNTWAKKNIDQWASTGMTLVTAVEQTGGRGRFKRHWESPPGVNIYASFCFLVDADRSDIGQIPQLLAYSAVKVLESLNFSPSIKWPNDILIGGKKMAGILCETVSHTAQGVYNRKIGMVCGIGLNINMSMDSIKKIDQPATSLFVHTNRLHDPDLILEKLVSAFNVNLQMFLERGFEPFFADFHNKNYYLCGQEICVQDGCHTWIGKFLTLNDDGSISLLLEDGTIKKCISGEIISQNS